MFLLLDLVHLKAQLTNKNIIITLSVNYFLSTIIGNAHFPVMTTCVSIEFVITQTLHLLCDSMTCGVMWTSVSLDLCSLSC